jgi:hypothetical protein
MAGNPCSNTEDPLLYTDIPDNINLKARILTDDGQTYLCFDLYGSLIPSLQATEPNTYNQGGLFLGQAGLTFNLTIPKVIAELTAKRATAPENKRDLLNDTISRLQGLVPRIIAELRAEKNRQNTPQARKVEINATIARLNALAPQNVRAALPNDLARLIYRILECLYWANTQGTGVLMAGRTNFNKEVCTFINFHRYEVALREELQSYDEATRTAILNLPFEGYMGVGVRTFGQFLNSAAAQRITPCLGTYITNIGAFYNENKSESQPVFSTLETGRTQHTREWFESRCAPFSTNTENSDPKLRTTLAKLRNRPLVNEHGRPLVNGGRRKNRRATKKNKRSKRGKNTRKN